MLHPNQTFPIDLDEERKDLAESEHRRFDFRYGSTAEHMELEDFLDELHAKDARAVFKQLADRLADTDDADRLANDTTPSEQVTLLVNLQVRQTLSELQAKKSKRPSPSSGGPSATGAALEKMAAAAS